MIALAIAAFLAASPALAQDELRVRDPATGKESVITGSIQKESLTEVVIQSSSTTPPKQVSATDLVEVIYEVPGGVRLAYARGRNDERRGLELALASSERAKALSDALKAYQEVLARLTSDRLAGAAAHLRYKLAWVVARLADDQPKERSVAIEAMKKWMLEHPNGWQQARAGRALLLLYQESGQLDLMLKECDLLSTRVELGGVECNSFALQAIDALAESEQLKALQERFARIAKDPRAPAYQLLIDARSGKGTMALSKARELLESTTDPRLKAAAYITIGDCLRLMGNEQEALWPYLWVDIVYSQDRHELGRAQSRLAALFTKLGQIDRGRQYLQRSFVTKS